MKYIDISENCPLFKPNIINIKHIINNNGMDCKRTMPGAVWNICTHLVITHLFVYMLTDMVTYTPGGYELRICISQTRWLTQTVFHVSCMWLRFASWFGNPSLAYAACAQAVF